MKNLHLQSFILIFIEYFLILKSKFKFPRDYYQFIPLNDIDICFKVATVMDVEKCAAGVYLNTKLISRNPHPDAG